VTGLKGRPVTQFARIIAQHADAVFQSDLPDRDPDGFSGGKAGHEEGPFVGENTKRFGIIVCQDDFSLELRWGTQRGDLPEHGSGGVPVAHRPSLSRRHGLGQTDANAIGTVHGDFGQGESSARTAAHLKSGEGGKITFDSDLLTSQESRVDDERRTRHEEVDEDTLALFIEDGSARTQRLPVFAEMKDAVHHFSHLLAPPALAIGGEMNRVTRPAIRLAAVERARHGVVGTDEMDLRIGIGRHHLCLAGRTEGLVGEHWDLPALPGDRLEIGRPLIPVGDQLIAIPFQSRRTRDLRIPTRRDDAAGGSAVALALHPVKRRDPELHPAGRGLLHRSPRVVETGAVIASAMTPRLERAGIGGEVGGRELLDLPSALSGKGDEKMGSSAFVRGILHRDPCRLEMIGESIGHRLA